jgi:hypothetical protein
MAGSLQNLDTVGYKRNGLSKKKKRNRNHVEGHNCHLTSVLFRHLTEGTEENNKKIWQNSVLAEI